MFKDYYRILESQPPLTGKELKIVYRRQCLKWHPDKNQDVDTTDQMQDIIEAYLLLKDDDARERYNRAYFKFRNIQNEYPKERSTHNGTTTDHGDKVYESESTYVPSDDILRKWMENAKLQAMKMKQDVIDEFKGASSEAVSSIVEYFQYIFIPMIIGFALFKSCTI